MLSPRSANSLGVPCSGEEAPLVLVPFGLDQPDSVDVRLVEDHSAMRESFRQVNASA